MMTDELWDEIYARAQFTAWQTRARAEFKNKLQQQINLEHEVNLPELPHKNTARRFAKISRQVRTAARIIEYTEQALDSNLYWGSTHERYGTWRQIDISDQGILDNIPWNKPLCERHLAWRLDDLRRQAARSHFHHDNSSDDQPFLLQASSCTRGPTSTTMMTSWVTDPLFVPPVVPTEEPWGRAMEEMNAVTRSPLLWTDAPALICSTHADCRTTTWLRVSATDTGIKWTRPETMSVGHFIKEAGSAGQQRITTSAVRIPSVTYDSDWTASTRDVSTGHSLISATELVARLLRQLAGCPQPAAEPSDSALTVAATTHPVMALHWNTADTTVRRPLAITRDLGTLQYLYVDGKQHARVELADRKPVVRPIVTTGGRGLTHVLQVNGPAPEKTTDKTPHLAPEEMEALDSMEQANLQSHFLQPGSHTIRLPLEEAVKLDVQLANTVRTIPSATSGSHATEITSPSDSSTCQEWEGLSTDRLICDVSRAISERWRSSSAGSPLMNAMIGWPAMISSRHHTQSTCSGNTSRSQTVGPMHTPGRPTSTITSTRSHAGCHALCGRHTGRPCSLSTEARRSRTIFRSTASRSIPMGRAVRSDFLRGTAGPRNKHETCWSRHGQEFRSRRRRQSQTACRPCWGCPPSRRARSISPPFLWAPARSERTQCSVSSTCCAQHAHGPPVAGTVKRPGSMRCSLAVDLPDGRWTRYSARRAPPSRDVVTTYYGKEETTLLLVALPGNWDPLKKNWQEAGLVPVTCQDPLMTLMLLHPNARPETIRLIWASGAIIVEKKSSSVRTIDFDQLTWDSTMGWHRSWPNTCRTSHTQNSHPALSLTDVSHWYGVTDLN